MTGEIYPQVLDLFREDFADKEEYETNFFIYSRHYDYKVQVEGGWKFFEFEDDYRTWKNQK